MSAIQRWLRLDGDDGWQIVMPEIDIKPHGAWDCPCKPKINYLDKIIVHNSFNDTERIDAVMPSIVDNATN